MDKLEQAAAKHGLIKLFLAPYEAVLVASCITWVIMDIQTTATELEKPHARIMEGFKNDNLREALDDLHKYCTLAWKDIIEHCAIHFKEIKDEKGFENWKNQLMLKEKDNLIYQKLRDYVSIGSKLANQTEKES